MYLVHDAPIKVNVSGDLMYDINSAIMNQVGVDMTMFDYVQQHVYSLIKIKTFARFRKSKGYASLESYRSRSWVFTLSAFKISKLFRLKQTKSDTRQSLLLASIMKVLESKSCRCLRKMLKRL
ncbi:hypothetical protein BC830DRAFT_1118147 [Chytriomyces sp. MP71]|nr:hypothetical protein BC830DRAFT_1125355 [Chytriomyces sp. MP71]KAI8616397.1 hypothetical protein BC830DRAFT_1118147 [Chytriomyces sp. MP71]